MKKLLIILALFGMCASVQADCSSPCVKFVRGDCNGDGVVSVGGVPTNDIFEALECAVYGRCDCACSLDAYDVNNDGIIGISDVIYLASFLNTGGAPPAQPYPDPGLDDATTQDQFDPDCEVNNGSPYGGVVWVTGMDDAPEPGTSAPLIYVGPMGVPWDPWDVGPTLYSHYGLGTMGMFGHKARISTYTNGCLQDPMQGIRGREIMWWWETMGGNFTVNQMAAADSCDSSTNSSYIQVDLLYQLKSEILEYYYCYFCEGSDWTEFAAELQTTVGVYFELDDPPYTGYTVWVDIPERDLKTFTHHDRFPLLPDCIPEPFETSWTLLDASYQIPLDVVTDALCSQYPSLDRDIPLSLEGVSEIVHLFEQRQNVALQMWVNQEILLDVSLTGLEIVLTD